MSIAIPCPFCSLVLQVETIDTADDHIMKCREKVSPRQRGDLDSFDLEEWEHGHPVREYVPVSPDLAEA